MIFLDINTNFSDHGGGIRTYHRAKADWFNRQRRHRYYLVVPGPGRSVKRLGPRAVRIEAYGLPLGCGYRLLVDFAAVWQVIRRTSPDVIEAGDPFLTGIFCLLLRRLGWFRGWLAAFYHSDPIETWVVPWAAATPRSGWREAVQDVASGLFYRLQRLYDATVVTSRTMENHLRAKGVRRLERVPLGADPGFVQAPSVGASTGGGPETAATRPKKIRLLYVGRLGKDKGADLLLQALPLVLQSPGVELTVLGSGQYEREFASASYPGLHCLGYVSDRARVAEIFREHQILLAPGPYETFGLAVLEAMASGLVVVGPDRGGTAELLAEADSPFVFRAGDLDDFVRATRSALAADLAPHAARARLVARQYGTWPEAIGRLIAYYERVAVRPAAPAAGSWSRNDTPGRAARQCAGRGKHQEAR